MRKIVVLSSAFVVMLASGPGYPQTAVSESRMPGMTMSDSRPEDVSYETHGQQINPAAATRAVRIEYKEVCDVHTRRVQIDVRGSIDGGAKCEATPG